MMLKRQVITSEKVISPYPPKVYDSSYPYYSVVSFSQMAFDSYIIAFYKCYDVKSIKHLLEVAKDDTDLDNKDFVRLYTIAHNIMDVIYERVIVVNDRK